MEIPNLEKYEAVQLKTLHYIIYKKSDVLTNQIKRGLRKFSGFAKEDFESNVQFIKRQLSDSDIIDICGILEVVATTNALDNITNIVKRLTPDASDNEVEDDPLETMSITKTQNSCSRRKHNSDKDNLLALIREQSQTIFNIEQEIFDAEDDVQEEETSISQHQLDRLRRKLSMHVKRKEILESEIQALDEVRSNSSSATSYPPSCSKKSETVRSWVNQQRSLNNVPTQKPRIEQRSSNHQANCTPQLDSITNEVKKILSKSSKDTQLPDFYGISSFDWSYFKMRYEVSTNDFKLSDDDNMIRLNSHLKGVARDKVDLILKSGKNPDNIIRILNTEYGGSEKMFEEILIKIRKVKKVNCLKDFRDFNCVVQNVQSVIAYFEDSFDTQKIMSMLLSKMPDHFVGQWINLLLTSRLSQKEVSFDAFSQWVDDFSGIVSEVSFFSTIHTSDCDGEKMLHEHDSEHPKQCETKIDNLESSKQCHTKALSSQKQCKVCKLDLHPLPKCEQFMSLTPQKRYTTAKKFNFCICCLNKHFGVCKKKQACQINNCGRFHHMLLHYDTNNITACSSSGISSVLLKIVSVRIKNGEHVKNVVAFLDEGATVSLIDKSLVEELNIEGCPEAIYFEGIGHKIHEDLTSQKVTFEIGGKNTGFYEIEDVHSISNLKLPSQEINMDALLDKYPQLKNMSISNKYSDNPQILLGQRHASLIVSRSTFEIKDGPICSKTKLGWAIHGPISAAKVTNDVICCLVDTQCCEERIDELLRNQFILENFGVNGSMKEELKEEDEKCLDIANNSIKKYEGYYEISLPWKDPEAELPNTLPTAMKRLQILERKFLQDSSLKESYANQIKKLLDRGYATKISFDDIKNRKHVWILPHFAVKNPKKPHKPPRVVFDAAAKVEGKSLNDFLFTGPDWLTSIVGVLIRFRQHSIAFAGDICEMFNRVRIEEKDTYAQCFLWTNSETKKIELYRMKAMLFGIKSAPFLAQFVKNYNATQYEQQFPEAYIAITKNHYVDDYLDGRDTVENAVEIIKDVINVHEKAGFQIRSFVSNNNDVLESIPNHLRADNFTVSMDSDKNYQKILGLNWNAKADTFEFDSFFKDFDEGLLNFTKIPTKRQVLKITMSIFDPLGLLSPITIKARLLMQTITNASIGWDVQINSEMFTMWKKWLTEISTLDKISIPRCYLSLPSSQVKRIELHIFSDASDKAYCSVAYYRFCIADGSYKVCLVFAKARVNPKSVKQGKMSIPRMELMAAVLGIRIGSVVLSETTFKIDQVFYWTDSSTVMVWIQNKKKLPVFETNRVKIILDNSREKDWRWLSTKVNIADIGTRDVKFETKSENEWFRGPKFLYEDEDNWDKSTGKYYKDLNTVEIVLIVQPTLNLSSCLPSVDNYSSYETLIKITAWIGRYLSNLKLKTISGELKLYSHIDEEDKCWALKKWVQLLQSESYPDDLAFIKHGIKGNRRLIKHSIKMEEEIMCIDGRLSNCQFISERTKNPIILDGNHKFVELLVLKMHDDVKHRNFQTLVNNFRFMFWMPKMKLKIKSIINKCLFCRKRDAKPVQPRMGLLPECRFNVFAKPFCSTGIDYFGPFQVKIGRRLEQRYGVLFTCMTSRAIHVELACKLNTDSCILAIRRMKSRRGKIQEIWSDNATNFKGSSVELLAAIGEIHPDLLKKELQKIGITWKNIPPRSPNFGGAWERMIGAFKRSIESIFVGARNPSEEVLHTVFCEAEYLINSRPLYSVSEDPLDSCPITPNDLLIPGEKLEEKQGDFSQDELHKRTWRIQQFLIECFWKKFLKEYIPTLIIRSKWDERHDNLKLGDLVFLKGEDVKKGRWPLAKVVAVYPGKDSIVRVVDVKLGDKILKRAFNQLSLCKLED